jgi:hypothetical protein
MSTVDEYLGGLPAEQANIASILRIHLTAGLPDAQEELWHGHPVWMIGRDAIAGFKAFPRWVTLLLWHPAKISDPNRLLTPSGGAGSLLALKLVGTESVDSAQLDRWISQLA